MPSSARNWGRLVMASEWATATIGDVAKIKHGFAFKGEFFTDEVTPNVLVTPGNFAIGGGFQIGKPKYYAGPLPDDYALTEGEVVVTMTDLSKASDTLGYAAKVPSVPGVTYWHNQRIGLLQVTDKQRACKDWLHYLMRTHEYRAWVVGSASGTTVKHTSPSRIESFSFKLPPLEEQRAIAETLGSLDDRIDNLRQTNATLEAIAAALFKSWFVDFDGVSATDMRESELGLIPKGWRIGSFDEAIEILGGGTPKTSIADYWSGDVPWFSVVDAPGSGQVFVLDTEKKITALGLQNCSAKLLPEMTTIISARGTVGKVAMTGVPMAMNQSCYALRPRQQSGEAFVYFSTLRFVEHLQRIAHGAVFDTITRDSFKQVTTCLPPDEVIAGFAEIANPLLERIRINGQQAAILAALRDALLPRLISGQLRVAQ
ncbi:restriction endonuclease subunit S [Verminephrobacter eiseniae]|nr:restriction endonuclease subunit S [Verminephrobacter eiseniae]MCW5302131.1 restriction endonuclease subunit S [Verminephrobacter eiseniae]MCW8179199.1 restriction endonuclease subunit S [Verminephrobacter eiseniae]MCW8191995.1 restriction endonuclease subunit S [Verminephrobacter eiseniae]